MENFLDYAALTSLGRAPAVARQGFGEVGPDALLAL
jgi:hypothetical protein